MIRRSLLFFLAAAMAAAVLLPAVSVADSSYSSVFSGYVGSGDIKSINNCNVIFTIQANATWLNVQVQNPYYSTENVTVTPGNSYYYFDQLLITLVQIDGNASRAYVDIAKPVATATPTPTGTRVYCDTPGQLALGGDTVTFPIAIQNYGNDHTYTLLAVSDAGWDTKYQYNNKDIYEIFVPEGQSRTVNLVVDTDYTSGIGTKGITARVDDKSLSLSVRITSVNSSADVSAKVGTVIASIGSNADFDLTIKNEQAQDNDYKLSVTGLPAGWYYRYKESAQSTSELAEAIVPAGSTKSLVLEIVPLVSATEGDYPFTAVVTTPDGMNITKDLTVRLKGSVSMSVTSDKLAYDAKPGEALSYKAYVTNGGKGEALTNVYADVSAPSGWTVSSTPSSITGIKAGETQAFTISVVPPANIVASDYSVVVNVKSDQQSSSVTYRITVTTSSLIPYIGGGVVLAVIAGLVLMYRKYGRR